MKKRQKMKILKRSGIKLHKKITLTKLESRVFIVEVESKLMSALCSLRNDEFNAGTIYEDGYLARVNKTFKESLTIENVTGVKKGVSI
ncbi:hypothetical protein [Bacillus sp. FJAT-45350]|uniref:hypothetical protein n=1 Tax=Bacillus sp. FJAT-45350 TaxID=2011014 RepID=UPI000BB80B2E|nr:hypothetical protein [Bacillus sp. FJAT-45350]